MNTLRIIWHAQTSDFGQPMMWFGSWLFGDGASEGDWFHSARGAAETEHAIPDRALAVRLRFWPSEGLDPEYIDLPVPESGVIETSALDYDRPGPHSRLELTTAPPSGVDSV